VPVRFVCALWRDTSHFDVRSRVYHLPCAVLAGVEFNVCDTTICCAAHLSHAALRAEGTKEVRRVLTRAELMHTINQPVAVGRMLIGTSAGAAQLCVVVHHLTIADSASTERTIIADAAFVHARTATAASNVIVDVRACNADVGEAAHGCHHDVSEWRLVCTHPHTDSLITSSTWRRSAFTNIARQLVIALRCCDVECAQRRFSRACARARVCVCVCVCVCAAAIATLAQRQ
jgi:hypothetical protein